MLFRSEHLSGELAAAILAASRRSREIGASRNSPNRCASYLTPAAVDLAVRLRCRWPPTPQCPPRSGLVQTYMWAGIGLCLNCRQRGSYPTVNIFSEPAPQRTGAGVRARFLLRGVGIGKCPYCRKCLSRFTPNRHTTCSVFLPMILKVHSFV